MGEYGVMETVSISKVSIPHTLGECGGIPRVEVIFDFKSFITHTSGERGEI